MVLRCTRRVLDLFGGRAAALTEPPPSDDDWYLNLLWLERRKCLLFTHAGTLFSAFVADVRAADIRPIASYAVTRIESELRSEGMPLDVFGPLDPDSVQLARTASRSVLGFMNDIAVHCRYQIAAIGGLGDCDIPCSTTASAEPCTTAATTSHRSGSSPSGSVRADRA